MLEANQSEITQVHILKFHFRISVLDNKEVERADAGNCWHKIKPQKITGGKSLSSYLAAYMSLLSNCIAKVAKWLKYESRLFPSV